MDKTIHSKFQSHSDSWYFVGFCTCLHARLFFIIHGPWRVEAALFIIDVEMQKTSVWNKTPVFPSVSLRVSWKTRTFSRLEAAALSQFDSIASGSRPRSLYFAYKFCLRAKKLLEVREMSELTFGTSAGGAEGQQQQGAGAAAAAAMEAPAEAVTTTSTILVVYGRFACKDANDKLVV